MAKPTTDLPVATSRSALTVADPIVCKVIEREPQTWLPLPPIREIYPTFVTSTSQGASFRMHPGRVAQAVPIKKVMPQSVNELLSDAADYLERGAGWCQEAMANNSDQVCAVGAILRMETGDGNDNYQPTQPFRHPLTTAAVEKLSKHLSNKKVRIPRSRDPDSDPHFDHVSAWNDTEGRTKAEVIKTLRDASK